MNFTTKLTRPTPMNWFVLLLVVAVGLALGLPPAAQSVHQLNITPMAYRLAVAVLLIPYIFIWYTGFYAVAKIQEYAKPLKGKDGVAFRQLTTGMWALALCLTVPTIIALILQAIANHNAGFNNSATIITNYVGMVGQVLAFFLIDRGSRTLLRTISGWSSKVDVRPYLPVLVLLGTIFAYLTVHANYQYHTYGLNTWVLLITLVAPYIFGWMLGLFAAYELRLYSQMVPGAFYKRPIRRFSYGLAITIAGAVAIQFVAVTISHSIKKSVGDLLLVDYLLLIVVAIGLLLIASSTKALKKIEEV